MLARYSLVAIGLHWLIAFALACELALGFGMPEAPAGFALWQFHKSLGIAILGLTILRLAWRLGHRPPAALEGGLAAGLARAAHFAFYALLLLAPLTGWAIVSTSATRIPTILFGVAPFPHLPLPDAGNAAAEQAHEVLAWLALGLIALHIAGVVRHDLLLRHRSLGRMSPGGVPALGVVLGLSVVLAGFATFAIVERRAIEAAVKPANASRQAEIRGLRENSGMADQATAPPEPIESASAAPAEVSHWIIQPGGQLAFSVANGDDVIRGRFAKWGGTIRFDPGRPDDAKIVIEIDLASATVGDATQDAMLAGGEYFSTSVFPKATVRISSARRTGANSYAAQGTLDLKGISRAETIAFRLSGTGPKRHVEGSASIARAPFDIGTGATGGALAPAVKVTFAFDAEADAPAD